MGSSVFLRQPDGMTRIRNKKQAAMALAVGFMTGEYLQRYDGFSLFLIDGRKLLTQRIVYRLYPLFTGDNRFRYHRGPVLFIFVSDECKNGYSQPFFPFSYSLQARGCLLNMGTTSFYKRTGIKYE